MGGCTSPLALGLVVALAVDLAPARAQPGRPSCCEPGIVVEVLEAPRPATQSPPAPPPADAAAERDYRQQLTPTRYGWPRRDHWCVWVEPLAAADSSSRWEQAWLAAVESALASWAQQVPLRRVSEPDQAQVRILRRRPPLRAGRASHGRAELRLVVVQRGDRRALEPQVQVLISPGQRASAMQATALHELGHAFGLWGHSDRVDDAMAAVPGAMPIVELSARDRATFLWLQQQPPLQLPPATSP
jgi:Asp-tRNA(Asn)/Glu-tRNA(Gln) amidotransferase A subunit family amidase